MSRFFFDLFFLFRIFLLVCGLCSCTFVTWLCALLLRLHHLYNFIDCFYFFFRNRIDRARIKPKRIAVFKAVRSREFDTCAAQNEVL